MTQAQDWLWSSAAAHVAGQSTSFVDVAPCLERVGNFLDFLRPAVEVDPRWSAVLKAEGAGWPVGAKEWIAQMEAKHGRAFTPAKRGPKAKGEQKKASETGDLFG